MAAGVTELTLNARNLSIKEAKFNSAPISAFVHGEQEKVVFSLPEPCQGGPAILDICFEGQISDQMNGLYRSKYTAVENGTDEVEKVMLVTYFVPTAARQVFPCWDEPDFKSVFGITLIVSKELTAISNMPVQSKTIFDDNSVAYVFEETPKMSTYLVAFAIGEFEFIEARDSNNVLIRVYSRPGMVSHLNRGQMALDVSRRALPFFGDYFDTQFPLPKLDLLAVPDFSCGAMENWGLVTFRERTLLVEQETASLTSKQTVALVVSHELAHMWFGNLVTMQWWTHLWLNEGFASWIEYVCVDHCFPEWDIWAHFTYKRLATALRLDALKSSHPIEIEVEHPDEIEEIFDAISYSKGASLIRMLHDYLGDETFRVGLRTYLSKHAYGNATTEDLWQALGAHSCVDVASLMRLWTKVEGFPLVKITPLSLEEGHVCVRLEQTRYQLPSSEPSRSSPVWSIPVTLVCHSVDLQHQSIFACLLDEKVNVVKIPVSFPITSLSQCIFQVNANATGYYHVCYIEEQLNMFTKNFQSQPWTVPGKCAFFNDGFAMAKIGLVPIDKWLKCLPYMTLNENSFVVWHCVLDGLSTHVRRVVHEGGISLITYHMYLRKLTIPPLNCLGFFDSATSTLSYDAQLLRSLLVLTAGAEAADGRVISVTNQLYNAHVTTADAIGTLPPELRLAILSIVVCHLDTRSVLDNLIDCYKTAQSPDLRSDLLSAICSSCCVVSQPQPDSPESASVSDRALMFCLDPMSPVRDQDRPQGLLICAAGSAMSRVATWEAIKHNWDRLTATYRGQFLFSRLLEDVLSGFATTDHIMEVKQFFKEHPVSFMRTVQRYFETMDTNHVLLVRDFTSICTTLSELAL